MKKAEVKAEQKTVKYLLNLSENQHYALKMKALNSKKSIKNLIIDALIKEA